MNSSTLFLHWFQYFYVPAHGPFWTGNVWGNVFVDVVIVPLAWLWSRAQRGERREHERWVAKHVAEMYKETTGREPDVHPHAS